MSPLLREIQTTVAWLAIAAILGTIVAVRAAHPPVALHADFYNPTTGEFTTRPSTDLPPIATAPGQLPLVRAIFVRTTPTSPRRLAYLEKFLPAARQLLVQLQKTNRTPDPDTLRTIESARLVRLPDVDAKWFPVDSDGGRAILNNIFSTTNSPSHYAPPP
jgi:hypothetical protein